MLLLFVHLRQRLPLFYHRNILCHGRPVLGMKVERGFVDWTRSILRLEDGELLKLGGLDALVTSNTFRLLMLFTFITAIPCLVILVPFYYFNSDTVGTPIDFDTFSIADLHTSSTLWPPLLVLAFTTFLVLYGVYAFYSNFVRMRQTFLLRPSSLSSIGALLGKTEAFGSIKAARRREDLPTVTVLLQPVPFDLVDPELLKENLESSGISGIESVQFIGNFEEVEGILEKRNSSLNKLEMALKSVTDKLRKHHHTPLQRNDRELTVKEKSNLLHRLISDVSFCSPVRPRHKTSKPAGKDPEPIDGKGTVDSLRHFYAKLVERDEKVHVALKNFNTPPKLSSTSDPFPSASGTSSDRRTEHTGDEFEKRYIEETTFISWSKVKNVSSNLTPVSGLESNQCALLHFSDYREAARAQQIMISSRPNAMESSPAPGPDELHWTFLKLNQRQRWYGAMKSNLFYWLLVLLFAPVLAAVAAFIDLRSLGKWIPAVETFRAENPNVRAVLEGVLAPFCAILILKWSFSWTRRIILVRGPMSRTELALKVQSAHVFFLFIQIILLGAIFSNVYEFTAVTIANNFKFGGFLAVLRENIPKKSHFFFNFMLQDVFTELMLELLNPKSLLLDRAYLNRKLRTGKTARKLWLHDTNPPELELALVWSRFIMFPLLIFMTYAVISPLIVIPTLAYFSYAYFVFRFRFSQYGRRSVETGGLYWKQCSRQLIYALLLGQLSVLLQYTQFRKGLLPAFLIICLLGTTIAFIPFLNFHFGRICENLSVLEDEAQRSKDLAVNLLKDRQEMLRDAVECLETSEIVKSKLDRDTLEHLNFTDIDPIASIQKDFNPPGPQSNTKDQPLFDPFWSILPLNFSNSEEATIETFDPFQVDRLIDTQYIHQQYSHPLLLKHSQVLVVSKDLPLLLLEEARSV